MSETPVIRARDRDAVLQSLSAGVVPRRGQQHVQVGRAKEVAALVKDLDRIGEPGEHGGSACRFVVGDYGSGKTFFLHIVRSIALEKRLVTAHADLSPDRRLQATKGQARALYSELMRNLATRSRPEEGALPSVVERFVTGARDEAQSGGRRTEDVVRQRLESLKEMVGGYDFADVIAAYWRGHEQGNDQLQSDAVRWLRGEFATKSEARTALGVRTIIADADFYDQLKLMARFVRLAGYAGLLVCLDEMVNLFKIPNSVSRSANYEQVLRILNDSLQGVAVGLGFVMCGTPESVTDTRRGLFSYPALESRLSDNAFARNGLVDLSGPVIRLAALTPEDLFVLLTKIRHVHAGGDAQRYALPNEALTAFMEHCAQRIGDAYFRTPRATVRAFVNLLAVLEQNPGVDWRGLLGGVVLEDDRNSALEPLEEDDAEGSVTGAPPQAKTPDSSVATGSRSPAAGSAKPDGDDNEPLASFKL